MIFRAIIEGGSNKLSQMDCFYAFFAAPNHPAATDRLESLAEMLLSDSRDSYEIYNVFSELELKEQAIYPASFNNAYLVENGLANGKPTYVNNALIFLIGDDRARVSDALQMANRTPL